MSAPTAAELKIELIGKYSAVLSAIEVALGSLLHAFHVPFAGNFLSLNQGYLLCRASLESRERGLDSISYSISNVTAVLKSLAPAGKKLGPMLSLSMQGLLFFMGEGIFGANLFGLSLGMGLLSLWTFIQPIITYYLFFGAELWKAFLYLFEKTVPFTGLGLRELILVLAGVVFLKLLVALALVVVVLRSRGKAGFQEKLLSLAKERGLNVMKEGCAPSKSSAVRLAIGDLFRPLFLVSLGITGFFLYFSQHSQGERFWIFMRPIGSGEITSSLILGECIITFFSMASGTPAVLPTSQNSTRPVLSE